MTRRALLGLIVALALPATAFAGGEAEQAASDDGAMAVEVAAGKYRESPMLTQLVQRASCRRSTSGCRCARWCWSRWPRPGRRSGATAAP